MTKALTANASVKTKPKAEKKAPAAKKAKKKVVPLITKDFAGSTETENLSVELLFSVTDNKITATEFRIETAQPENTSIEAMLNPELNPPWVERITGKAVKFENNEDGSFVAKGPARAYLEHLGERFRAVPLVTITGKYEPELLSIVAEVEARYRVDADEEMAENFVKKTEDGAFRFFYRGDVVANPKEDPKKKDAKAEGDAAKLENKAVKVAPEAKPEAPAN